MARTMSLCAGLGLFCILSSCVLIIFAQIGQISESQTVIRHLQMTTVNTVNLGPTLSAAGIDTASLYGSGERTAANSGIRQYYKWGLWTNCASTTPSGTSDVYCAKNSFGHRFQPVDAIYADLPTALQTDVANAIGNNYFTNTTSGTFTHAAFYLFFVGAILSGISLVTALLAHRFAFFVSALTGFLAFLFIGVGAALWTVVLQRTRSALTSANVGISVSYGNGLWIAWAACAAALLSVIPFLLSCCFGGNSRRERDEYADEKY